MVLTAKGTDMGRWDVLGRRTAPSLNGQKEQFGDRLFGADSQFSEYILISRGSGQITGSGSAGDNIFTDFTACLYFEA